MTDKAPLTDEQLAKIREEFDFFDRDNNGSIDQDEFHELLKTLSPSVKKAQSTEGFLLIDENADGVIDFNEFLSWWQNNWWEY